MLPRDSIFLAISPPRNGEHQFAAYNEDHQDMGPNKERPLFFNKNDGRIQNFMRLPANHEIFNLEFDIEKFKSVNMPKNLRYNLGSPAEKVMPEFVCNNSLEKIKQKIQKLTIKDCTDVEEIVKERQRLVEFQEAYDYSCAGYATSYLKYFKAMSNIFDLEFFTNKLATSA